MARLQAEYGIHEYAETVTATFDEEPFNDVDGLIFTQLATMDFSAAGIDLANGTSKTIAQIYEEIKDTEEFASMTEDNQRLLASMAQSTRYQNVELSNYVKNPYKNGVEGFSSVGEEAYAEQFGAVTASYTENGNTVHFLSFQSTDDSADGWNEDLLLISSTCTQAQADSVVYVNLVASLLVGDLVGGGHSKGGNNFEYAYLFCDDQVRSRIVAGYLYDSPGLYETIIAENEHYAEFLAITEGHFYCPQDSVFGLMLHENENASFVYSVESGFNEHDPYSWEVSGNGFVAAEQSQISIYINRTIDLSVLCMTAAERQVVYAVITYLFYNSGDDGMNSFLALLGEGWTTSDGSFSTEKLIEVLTIFHDDWNSLSIKEQLTFCRAVCVIATTIVLVGLEQSGQQFSASLAAFVRWAKSVASTEAGSADSDDGFVVDTDKMSRHASSLRTLSKQAKCLDSKMNRLYWRLCVDENTVSNLKNLLYCEALSDYAMRLDRCAAYLEETVLEFEAAEREVGYGCQF